MGVKKSERSVPVPVDGGALVAHEINNPLASLLNLLYLLYLMKAEASFTEKGRHYLALAEEEIHRISQIAHGAMKGFRCPMGPQDTDAVGAAAGKYSVA